jgi:hypothetical protein
LGLKTPRRRRRTGYDPKGAKLNCAQSGGGQRRQQTKKGRGGRRRRKRRPFNQKRKIFIHFLLF